MAGDCQCVQRYIPDQLGGKRIATHTTSQEEVKLLRQVVITDLVTSTFVHDGRSFSKNMYGGCLDC